MYLPNVHAACDTHGIAPPIIPHATVQTHGALPLAKSNANHSLAHFIAHTAVFHANPVGTFNPNCVSSFDLPAKLPIPPDNKLAHAVFIINLPAQYAIESVSIPCLVMSFFVLSKSL